MPISSEHTFEIVQFLINLIEPIKPGRQSGKRRFTIWPSFAHQHSLSAIIGNDLPARRGSICSKYFLQLLFIKFGQELFVFMLIPCEVEAQKILHNLLGIESNSVCSDGSLDPDIGQILYQTSHLLWNNDIEFGARPADLGLDMLIQNMNCILFFHEGLNFDQVFISEILCKCGLAQKLCAVVFVNLPALFDYDWSLRGILGLPGRQEEGIVFLHVDHHNLRHFNFITSCLNNLPSSLWWH